MGLTDLTRPSVLQAIAEFDRLGRDAFLRKYGFGRSTGYFLSHDGTLYDSKAIAGAAHGYLSSLDGPLRFNDFSGGYATVKPVLEDLGFTVLVRPRGSNPRWHRDELIVALAFYMRHRGRSPDKRSVELRALVEDIRTVAAALGSIGNDDFRNANGVAMTVEHFRQMDPEFSRRDRAGLDHRNTAAPSVWREFSDRPDELQNAAKLIVDLANALLDEGSAARGDSDFEGDEGGVATRVHLVRERDRKLVAAKKRDVLKRLGRLSCECCDFDFEEHYGERGRGFVECHHNRPLSSLSGSTKMRISDLSVLCANCHRMIHTRSPWMTVSDLRDLFGSLQSPRRRN